MKQALTKTNTKSLRQRKQWKFTTISLQTVSDNTGTDKDKVAFIAEVINETIKDLGPQRATVELTSLIPVVAEEYGVTEPVPPNVTAEAVKLVWTRHSDLNLRDIREAYREFVDGTLFENHQDAETWKGKFSVKQLGRILRAYKIQRNRIKAALIRSAEEEKEIENSKQMHEIKKQQFEKRFKSDIDKAKQMFSDWESVPSFWYNYLFNNGKIKFSEGEKRRFWIHACELVKVKLLTKSIKLSDVEFEILRDGYNRKFKHEELKSIRRSIIEEAEVKAKVISKQIVVFRKVIQNPTFTF